MTISATPVPSTAPSEKLRMRFDWNAVHDDVVTALLTAVYAAEPERLENLRDAAHRRAQAERVFGSPITAARLDQHPAAWDVLLNDWLIRRATTQQLADVAGYVRRAEIGPGRQVSLNNRAEMRAYFRGRRWSQPLRSNLLRVFRQAHRTKQATRRHGHTTVGASDSRALTRIAGEELAVERPLYQHQVEAVDGLRSLARAGSPENRRGIVVIPTGGGKTVTAVSWILERMAADPQCRVLWIAQQEELLVQAKRALEEAARHESLGFQRSVRVISGNHSTVTTLADEGLDVAFATVQSLHRSWETTKRLVSSFIARPTIVVVDEAHHAGACSYQDVLREVVKRPNTILIGLTATPYPTGSLAAARLRGTFQRTIVDVSAESLHSLGILATPILHTVQTQQSLELTPSELRMARGDLPPKVLQYLQNAARDGLVTRLWTERKATWGKTLVFATSQAHADSLGGQFEARGVPVKVLHGAVSEHRGSILGWFKAHRGPCVLVSVGMLTEGVDLPDARTAFLARPTTSRILLRQMIGRVLRGPLAAGTSEAHLVYFRDNWTNFEDVLDPAELPDIPVVVTGGGESEHRLPPIIDNVTGSPIGEDILAEVWRMYQRRTGRIPLDPATSRTRLCGYYVTTERHIPVMEHQIAGFHDLIDRSMKGSSFQGTPLQSLFDDTHPPYPTDRALMSIRGHIAATGLAPDFVEIESSVDPREVATRLRGRKAFTDKEREAWLQKEYESSLARIAYPSFDHFEEAVERELREIRKASRDKRNPLNAERPAAPLDAHDTRPRLIRSGDRQLPTLSSVVARMREVLVGEPALDRLMENDLPELDWSKRESQSAWAYWSLKTSGKAAGRAVIRVNCMLRAPRTQIADEVLSYLIFHEMLHDLLPGQGHDAEFRRLEAKWPGSDQLDLELDTLHEQFAMGRPSKR